MRTSELIQQSCCGHLGEKALFVARVKRMEEVLESLVRLYGPLVEVETGYTIEELNDVKEN